MDIKKIIITTASAFAFANFAHAAGQGEVKFTGSIVDAPCSIHADSINQTVELGAVSSNALKNGGTSTPREFTIKLEQCDFENDKNKVTTTFTGVASPYAAANELLTINGTASGAGVAIEGSDGGKITLGVPTAALTLTGSNPTLQYKAYLQGGVGTESDPVAINPGEFTAVANFELAYP